MHETAFFTTLLHEYDAMETITLHQLPGSSFDEGYLCYKIQHANGTTWMAQAYQRHHLQPDWFHHFYPWATDDIAEWLLTRAATLCYLEQQNYLAPRVLRTRAGTLLGMTAEWCLLIVTFVEGTVLQPTLEQLGRLGAALASLHTLNLEQASIQSSFPGKSYWDAEHAFSTVQTHLMSVEHRLPAEWRTLHAEFSQTLQRLQLCSHLTCTVIHGDIWAANAIQTPTGQVALIDWNSGGLGPTILDLGRLLLECHLDSNLPADDPLVWHIQPDEHRIAAVVDGYAQRRQPTSTELEILLDGLRFGIVFIGALHFTQALQDEAHTREWVRGMNRRFARLQNRWEVSSEIASIARKRFDSM